jgi:hypothetical protein
VFEEQWDKAAKGHGLGVSSRLDVSDRYLHPPSMPRPDTAHRQLRLPSPTPRHRYHRQSTRHRSHFTLPCFHLRVLLLTRSYCSNAYAAHRDPIRQHIGIHDARLQPLESSAAAMQGRALQPLCHRPLESWRPSLGSKAAVQRACKQSRRVLVFVTSRPLCAGLDKSSDANSPSVWAGQPGCRAPPESNRRPHPYHGTTRNRCADHRFPRSRPTVEAKVIGSHTT